MQQQPNNNHINQTNKMHTNNDNNNSNTTNNNMNNGNGSNSNNSNNQNINSNNRKQVIENYRPTYGAYISNTLPRGPYLQYKCKDLPKSAIGVFNQNNKQTNDNNSNNTITNRQHQHLHHQTTTATTHHQSTSQTSINDRQQQQQQLHPSTSSSAPPPPTHSMQQMQKEKKQLENQFNRNNGNAVAKSKSISTKCDSDDLRLQQQQQQQHINQTTDILLPNDAQFAKTDGIDAKQCVKKYEEITRKANQNVYGSTAATTAKNVATMPTYASVSVPPAKPPRLYLHHNYDKKNANAQHLQQQQQPQHQLKKSATQPVITLSHSSGDFRNPIAQNMGSSGHHGSYHRLEQPFVQNPQQLQHYSNSDNHYYPVMSNPKPTIHPKTIFNSNPYTQHPHSALQAENFYSNSEFDRNKPIQTAPVGHSNQNPIDIHITEPREQIYYNKNMTATQCQSNGLLAIATTTITTAAADNVFTKGYESISVGSDSRYDNEKLSGYLSSKDIMQSVADKPERIMSLTADTHTSNNKSKFYECFGMPQQINNIYGQWGGNQAHAPINANNIPNRYETIALGSGRVQQSVNNREMEIQSAGTNRVTALKTSLATTSSSTDQINFVNSAEPKSNLSGYQQYLQNQIENPRQQQQQQQQLSHYQQLQRQKLTMAGITTGNDLLTLCQQMKLNMTGGGNGIEANNQFYRQHIDGILNINSAKNYFKFPSQSIAGAGGGSGAGPYATTDVVSCASSRGSYDNVVMGVPTSPLPMMGVSVGITGRKRIQSEIKYVTLADVMSTKSGRLSEVEMWALLCQSVQALQDLFLSDTPSTAKVLPLVKAATIQITSRGRIVFRLTPASQYAGATQEAVRQNEAAYFDITAHLSPEYLSSIGKKITYPETDVEKMWIYSLGTTLRNTMENNARTTIWNRNVVEAPNVMQKLYKDVTNDNNRNCTTTTITTTVMPTSVAGIPKLEQVIRCMCEENLQQRASLMHLLDVISKYFRSQFQIKPFSHIVMEIFKEVAYKLEKLRNPHYQLEVEKSEETDSGRSSDNCIETFSQKANHVSSLKVVKEKTNMQPYGDYDKCGTIGFAGIKTLQAKKEKQVPQLIVRRRNRETIKKRNSRRNTIDVNAFDLEKASKIIEQQGCFNASAWNTSRSTNYLDKLMAQGDDFESKIDKMRLSDGFSVPEVNKMNLEDDLNVKISNIFSHMKSEQNLMRHQSEESFLGSCHRGPEFILKSSNMHRSIRINKSKSMPLHTVHIILLNGQSLHIKCNYLTTTTKEIFKAVIESENYVENFYLGLCALIGGDFVFLPSDLKIYKVAPQNWLNAANNNNNNSGSSSNAKKFSGSLCNVFFTLFLRIKFYLPNFKGVSCLQTRHMLYLQLRKNILEKSILCTDDDLVVLGGLALQAEMGDYTKSMEYTDYFKVSHYLPEDVYCRNKEIAKHLRNSHYCRRGMNCKEAEFNYVKYLQEMKEYGFHLYSANWILSESTFIKIYLGISLGGITFFERNCDQIAYPMEKLIINQNHMNSANSCSNTTAYSYNSNSSSSIQNSIRNNNNNNTYKILLKHFEWLEIENICFSKHILCIVVRKLESLKAKDNNKIKFKLRMDDKKSYFAFSLASEHHQFYLKLRNSFASLKSISNELNIPITSGEDNSQHKQQQQQQQLAAAANQHQHKPHKHQTSKLTSSRATAAAAADDDKHTIKTISLSSPPPLPPSAWMAAASSSSLSSSMSLSASAEVWNTDSNSYCGKSGKAGNTSSKINIQMASLGAASTPPQPLSAAVSKNCATTALANQNFNSNCPYHQYLRSQQQHHFDSATEKEQSKESINSNEAIKTAAVGKSKAHTMKSVKKSMLNDNRLTKLKDKFLRRTKSTASNLESNLKHKFRKDKVVEIDSTESLKAINRSDCCCTPTTTTGSTEEEHQNKENECPTIRVLDHHPYDAIKETTVKTHKQQFNASVEMETMDANKSGTKVCSPNRNRVKMGTRVFSSQFLNKSYDNIYDRFKQLNVGGGKMGTDGVATKPNRMLHLPSLPQPPSSPQKCAISRNHQFEDDTSDEIDGGGIYDTIDYKRETALRNGRKNLTDLNGRQQQFDVIDSAADDTYHSKRPHQSNHHHRSTLSPPSSSSSSSIFGREQQDSNCGAIYSGVGGGGVYCKINKANQLTNKCAISLEAAKSPEYKQQQQLSIRGSAEGEAYVIHANLSNASLGGCNNFSINDDTISDSLMERINNLSHVSSYGTERLLQKVVVIKEPIDGLGQSISVAPDGLKQQNQASPTKKASPQAAAGVLVKYSTFSPGKVKTLLRSFSNIDCIRDQSRTACDDLYGSHPAKLNKSKHMEAATGGNEENLYQEIGSISHPNDADPNAMNDDLQNYTLGISIVQGCNDSNVYVKDLIKNGPGCKAGISIGDQIIAVNGISLLSLSYKDALDLLQHTGRIVEMTISKCVEGGTVAAAATQSTSTNQGCQNNECKIDDSLLHSDNNINYLHGNILQQQQQEQQQQLKQQNHIRTYKAQSVTIDDEPEQRHATNATQQHSDISSKLLNRRLCNRSADSSDTTTTTASEPAKHSKVNQMTDINHRIVERRRQQQQQHNDLKRYECNWKHRQDVDKQGQKSLYHQDDELIDGAHVTTSSMSNVCTTALEHTMENYRNKNKQGFAVAMGGCNDVGNKMVSAGGYGKIGGCAGNAAAGIGMMNMFDPNISRSLPDIPKVISVLPNGETAAMPHGETVEYATVLRKSQRRISNHSRKYIGPMRYPVTPKKLAAMAGNKHGQPANQLSINEHSQQVLI